MTTSAGAQDAHDLRELAELVRHSKAFTRRQKADWFAINLDALAEWMREDPARMVNLDNRRCFDVLAAGCCDFGRAAAAAVA